MIRHDDTQITALEEHLHKLTQEQHGPDYALLQTVPGIGEHLGLTILYQIGDIARFPSVKDFLSYGRLVKDTVASAGKIKGLRGAKLGNPYLRWAFGEAAVIAKRDHPDHDIFARDEGRYTGRWRRIHCASSAKSTGLARNGRPPIDPAWARTSSRLTAAVRKTIGTPRSVSLA